MWVLYRIVSKILNLYELAILIRVSFSWLNIRDSNVFTNFIYSITEPLLRAVRELLYDRLGINTGMLDISPVIAIVFLRLIFKVVASILF